MDGLKFEDLTLTVEEGAKELKVHWTGRSNSRNPSVVLAPFFDQALRRASGMGASLALHFELLEHFNSSTIASVIQLIHAADAASVPLRLVYDRTQRWQTQSFDALQRAMKPFEGAGSGRKVEFVAWSRA